MTTPLSGSTPRASTRAPVRSYISKAINSMSRWHEKAQICYVYLTDVAYSEAGKGYISFRQSVWWTRAWTLQELLAPRYVRFFSNNWQLLGDKVCFAKAIKDVSGIDYEYLNGAQPSQSPSIAERMSWACKRVTTRIEDVAYCLLGIFSVSMPLLYGEGNRAFIRLQEEIIRTSDDHPIFAWRCESDGKYHGLLADHPSAFSKSHSITRFTDWEGRKPFSMTNMGLSTELLCSPLHVARTADDLPDFIAALACTHPDHGIGQLGVQVRTLSGSKGQFARVNCPSLTHVLNPGVPTNVFVPQTFVTSLRQKILHIQDNQLFLCGVRLYDDETDERTEHFSIEARADATSNLGSSFR